MTDYEDLILRLYCSTERMAHLPCSDMELWNEHSNAVLKASTAIKELVAEVDSLNEDLTAAYLLGARDYKERAERAEADLAAARAEMDERDAVRFGIRRGIEWVSRYVSRCGLPYSRTIADLIDKHFEHELQHAPAVEAEADDDISRVYEEAIIPPASALDSWQPSYNRPVEAKACENCGYGGYMASPICECCVRDRNNLFQFPHWKPKTAEAVCPLCGHMPDLIVSMMPCPDCGRGKDGGTE